MGNETIAELSFSDSSKSYMHKSLIIIGIENKSTDTRCRFRYRNIRVPVLGMPDYLPNIEELVFETSFYIANPIRAHTVAQFIQA